ncbi:hypothetical protein LTR08_009018 [Meristemomyces frigidus]|nr:hypothetical protein LTR08_009018 [Meristemomyces frigidus]
MAPSRLLHRNVRPTRVAEEEYDDQSLEDEELDGSEVDGDEDQSVGSQDESADDGGGAEADSDAASSDAASDQEDDVEQKIVNISFGTLKQAHEALSKKRKRGPDINDSQNDKLEALRKRLRQIKEEKAASQPQNSAVTQNDDAASDAASDSDSAPSEEGASTARSSKHAPRSQTTRHQVTRKRAVVDVPKRVVRDPRFDAVQQRSAHAGDNMDKAYAFLADYQKSEIEELKVAAKATVDEDERVLLRRRVNAMENRVKAKAAKAREQEVRRVHRKEEKGRVEMGKTPYYLKEKEVKERALVEKFRGMKGKERERAVEKRRKKESQAEIKRMPANRRVVG